MSEFSVTRTDHDTVSALHLTGYLDLHTVPEFENALRALLDANRFQIVVNMEHLEYISSAGLGVFMGFIEEIREQNGDIKLCCLSQRVFKVFDLLGFPALFNIFNTADKAFEAFE